MPPFKSTPVWKNAFEKRKADPNEVPRDRLRSALDRMRDNVAVLLTTVPGDCKDLTVHDVSHLDALWEMASLLAPNEQEMNPAEVFVLGASILIHDAGLSLAAFPGGIEDLIRTDVWLDIAAAVLRGNGLDPSSIDLRRPPLEHQPEIKFAVLRALHAEQAERMAYAPWKLNSGAEIYLLDDVELRQAFGASIGRVAHSHNWSIERVADKLADKIGAGTVLPAEWSINERKIACYLRCADAAHIDRRRAPTILMAATRPAGISNLHWTAQNKINKPTVSGGALVYTTGQPFRPDEADAWWVAFDLIRLIDKEIRISNGLLEELGLSPLKINRVLGAESPRALSAQVRAEGWRPVDAEVRVSDPIHLAQTLGGRNLYGTDELAPIRELLQNSVDAVRARRQIEDREETWGQIRVTIEVVADDESACWLHVDDDGVGMSERVMSGPLVDFGRSIWNSELLREEMPGLQAKKIRPIGKYGIGFFSVFELGDEVRVISRRFDAAMSDAKVLEFRSISRRPLLRPANSKELPRDTCTRVSVKVKDKQRFFGSEDRSRRLPWHMYSRPHPRHGDRVVSLAADVLRLVSMVDVKIDYQDRISGASFQHSPEVYESDPSEFLEELIPVLTRSERDLVKATHGPQLRPITDDKGALYGRAAIALLENELGDYGRPGLGGVSVGGFVYDYGRAAGFPAYVGVVEGTSEIAARSLAESRIPKSVIATWASEQARLIDQSKFLKSQLLRLAEAVVTAGGDPGPLPYCFAAGQLIDFAKFKELLSSVPVAYLPLRVEYKERWSLIGYSEMTPAFFDVALKPGVFVLRRGVSQALSEATVRRISEGGSREITRSDLSSEAEPMLRGFVEILERVWGVKPMMSVHSIQIFENVVHCPPPPRWAIAFQKDR